MPSIPKYTEDFYSILDIAPNATTEEITKAYRNLARVYHPDKNRDAGSTATFQLASQAYSVLSNPIQRLQYDREDYPAIGTSPRPGNSTGGEEYGFNIWNFCEFETHDFQDNRTKSDSTQPLEPNIELKRLFRELLPDQVLSSGCLPLRWREILYQHQNRYNSYSEQEEENMDYTFPTKYENSDGGVERELMRYRGNVKVTGGDWIGEKGWDGFVLYGCNWS